MNNYILNTIAFNDQLDAGVPQAELVAKAKDMGFNHIEIRNEFLNGGMPELQTIKENAESVGIGIYYSVNDPLIKDRGLNPDFKRYLKEMEALGSTHLKMNVGNMGDVSSDLPKDIFNELSGVSGFEFNVENNQTLEESRLENIVQFFDLVRTNQLPIGFCFDTANWYWTESDPITAAGKLSSVTKYLHLKNMTEIDGNRSATSLDKGSIDIQSLITQFNVTEYGFEYAAPISEIEHDLDEVKAL